MSPSCSLFRRLLEGTLSGKPDADRLTDLGFHEHLSSCATCRELLEAEEALEVLLASWPEPGLPAALSARLVRRLREARRLEELLDLDAPPPIPVGLAGRVLQSVGARSGDALESGSTSDEDRRLDAWLDRAGVVEVPEGLGARVLRGLRTETAPALRRLRYLGSARRIAAALLMTLALAGVWRLSDQRASGVERALAVPSDEFLSALPVLENWEVLFNEDDLELATGMDFSPEDEALLDFAGIVAEEDER